ncbi:dienelactone hydrolase family protein [Xanthomonas albilineans]|uniref:dienelactone hydrolase family protein n=1 Tax=Xanthomonas albilineans TaxID=29447 RepID=UPI000AADF639|nr:hypothetical protein [Xanthomonas albilineans]
MTLSLHNMLATTALLLCGATPWAASATGFSGGHANLGEPLHIPIADPDGHPWTLQGRLCRPVGVHRPRVVVIAHGSPANAADRPGMTLETCDGESARWFLHRHYAVALVLRLGYGATGGPWSEGYDGCERADYAKAGLETARQLKTIVAFVTALPGNSPNGAIVVGQSAGGWGTLAYNSLPHPNVSAFVNMAGGRGGHFHNLPNSNCHPDKLIEAAATFGKSASTPMLWIYTANDSFFGPPLAAALHRAFTEAGGRAMLVTPGAYGEDGHHLFFGHGGSAIWGPSVERYLASVDTNESQ